VNYWRHLTGERVTYVPYQEVAAQHPSISADEFQRAVQYVAEDGEIARAAEASFRTLSHAPGGGIGLFFDRKLPGFAAASEWIYAFIAKRRTAFHRISLFLWGRDHAPGQYKLVTWLLLRELGLIFCRLRFLRRAGHGTDREPRHPTLEPIRGGGACPAWHGALLAAADAVLARQQ
jgi:hypothetical protein